MSVYNKQRAMDKVKKVRLGSNPLAGFFCVGHHIVIFTNQHDKAQRATGKLQKAVTGQTVMSGPALLLCLLTTLSSQTCLGLHFSITCTPRYRGFPLCSILVDCTEYLTFPFKCISHSSTTIIFTPTVNRLFSCSLEKVKKLQTIFQSLLVHLRQISVSFSYSCLRNITAKPNRLVHPPLVLSQTCLASSLSPSCRLYSAFPTV